MPAGHAGFDNGVKLDFAGPTQYLQSLPLDHIKIARTLIPQLPLSVHDVAVVRTIIGIGRDMGLGVLAAGIETEPQRECLEQLGCAFWQGWLFDLPSPALEFEARLTSTSQTATRSAKPVTH
jgi:EAL domain-containing protein (putative c-di-GMP-specific phosphodiesterase class I)